MGYVGELTCNVQRHVVWDLDNAILRHDDLLRKPSAPAYPVSAKLSLSHMTLLTTQSHKSIVITAVDQSLLARSARPIVYDRLYAHPVSNRKALRHALAHLLNRTAEFMSERQRNSLSRNRVGRGRAERRSTEELVQVAGGELACCVVSTVPGALDQLRA